MIKKSQQEILDMLLKRLTENTAVTDLDPGNIARTFTEVLSQEFYDFYNQLEVASTMSFVSTASGQFLDLLGSLLNCKRTTNETDTNYRTRIANQVYVIAGANYTAVRLRALSVAGVKDIVAREYTRGAGSFSIYVIADNPDTPEDIVAAVDQAVNITKAFGVYAEVRKPALIPMELMVRLVFDNGTADAEKSTIRQNVKQSLKNYVDNIPMGESFVVNEVVRRTKEVSKKVLDLEIYNMRIAGLGTFVRNIPLGWDQRLVAKKLDVM